MGRYRRGDERWSIAQTGLAITVVDPHGFEHVETFEDLRAARRRFDVLTHAKRRDGWTLVPDEPGAATPPIARVENARNIELEAAILEDLDAVEPWLVYGDWLQQQGDPRGTHIALRRAMLDAPADLLASDRLRRFEQQHRPYLFDDMTGELGWGFLARMGIGKPSHCAGLCRDAARFLRGIEIACNASWNVLARILDAMVHAPSTVTSLRLEAGRVRSTTPLSAIFARATHLELHHE